MLSDRELRRLAARLVEVPGVVGVLLGGSRSRGEHAPDSDIDLGVYYRPPLGLPQLTLLARDVAGPEARATAPGDWGPWVDGGAWLDIEGTAVDWIYRDVDRVHAAWADAREGRYGFHFQVGHPLGFADFTYAGEVALGVVLADPTTELTALQRSVRTYPDALGDALIQGLDEAAFTIRIARKAVSRSDTTYVAGCLFRAVGVCAHALHGAAHQWLLNEKGAIASAARLPLAPEDFSARAHGLMADLGTTPAELGEALDAAASLLRDTAAACRHA